MALSVYNKPRKIEENKEFMIILSIFYRVCVFIHFVSVAV